MNPGPTRKIRVLFIAEAVTLAHVSRPAYLANSLPCDQFDVVFASARRYEDLLGRVRAEMRTVSSIETSTFLDALANGRPLHDTATLKEYVEEDLKLLRDVRPDIVVGDLRYSLAVSARIAKVPYAALTNAYWSPFARQRFTIPDVPAVRVLGVKVSDALFQVVRPFIFARHCAPMNAVRRAYGEPGRLNDIRNLYSDADWVLYADVPELIPTANLPANHRYIGPVIWSPEVPRPAWWETVPRDRRIVYVTAGSSGSEGTLHTVLNALANESVTLLVAAVKYQGTMPPNAFAAPYLPGAEASAMADLVISNGGSPTSYQALSAGKPVLGIPSNMDQHVSMSFVARSGAGVQIRSDQINDNRIREAVRAMLTRPDYRARAESLQRSFARYNACERFAEMLVEITGRTGVPATPARQ